MINLNNKEFIKDLIVTIKNLEKSSPTHNALLFDVSMALREERDKKGDDYPYCGTCRRPAFGVSKNCAECKTRYPKSYEKSYSSAPGTYWNGL